MRTGIIIIAALGLLPAIALSATIHVPADQPTIQAGIDAAVNGDTVLVAPGTYVENVDFKGKAITVRSGGSSPAMTVIDGQAFKRSVVKFISGEGPDSVLEGFTLTNGSGTSVKYVGKCGGGIYCYGASPTLIDNIITGNSAVWGGGIACRSNSSKLNISGCIITGNHATENGGGIHCRSSDTTINNCLITYNTGILGGGIYYHYSSIASPEISNCTITANSDTGIHCYIASEPIITNSIIWDNGPYEIYDDGSNPVVTYCDVKGGWPGTGNIDTDPLFVDESGGVFHLQQDPCQPGIINPCVEAGDPASVLPGGATRSDLVMDTGIVDMGYHDSMTVFVPDDHSTIQGAIDALPGGGTVLVRPGTYVENLTLIGKAISLKSFEGPLSTVLDGNQAGSVVSFLDEAGPGYTLEGFTVRNGLSANGGGVYCYKAATMLSNNIIKENTASGGHGGGICIEGASPKLLHNTVYDNSATKKGGGLALVLAEPFMDTNTIFNNQADSGGGLSCLQSSPVMVNGLIYGNSAATGGGLSSDGFSAPVLTNNTFYGNTAYNAGGGIDCGSGNPTITNCILWHNTAPSGAQIQGVNPWVTHSDVEGGWPGTGNLDLDPLFKNPGLADLHLTLTSPCIDKGDGFAPSLPDLDYDGDPRIAYGLVDMGMDEYTQGGKVLHVPVEYPTISDAIDVAYGGDIVLVAPGTYMELIDFGGKAITIRSEFGREVTVIDGNNTGCVITCQSGEGSDTALEGFTITNGSDGGMSNWNSSPKIMNCIFCGNIAYGEMMDDSGGGGMANWESDPTVINCVFYDNCAYGEYGGAAGGGMFNYQSNPIVTDCVFSNNTAEAYCSWGVGAAVGGGMYNTGSSPTVTNCLFSENHVSGLRVYRRGGGVCNFGGHSVFTNCTFSGNSAADGGGIFNGWSCNLTVVNCTFFENSAGYGGGIFIDQGCNPIILNCTFSNNSAYDNGGGLCIDYDSFPTVTNCILWYDTPDEIYGYGVPDVTYSNVQGGYPGTGNIDSDPLFVDPAGGDLHLTFNSPCRASGNNVAVTAPTDIEGDPRIAYGTVDMGADEFYTHLYYTGSAPPGGSVELKFTDLPGTTPVGFWIAFDALESPIPGAYGDWWLLPPMTGYFALGAIPSNGVCVLPGMLPASTPGPYTLYLQALIGMKLTNLCTIMVQ